jgi:hypothetical protein
MHACMHACMEMIGSTNEIVAWRNGGVAHASVSTITSGNSASMLLAIWFTPWSSGPLGLPSCWMIASSCSSWQKFALSTCTVA